MVDIVNNMLVFTDEETEQVHNMAHEIAEMFFANNSSVGVVMATISAAAADFLATRNDEYRDKFALELASMISKFTQRKLEIIAKREKFAAVPSDGDIIN